MLVTIVDGLVKTMDEEYYSYIKEWFKKESRFYHLLVDVLSIRFRNKIVDLVGAREGSEILDVATGTGGLAFAFAKKGYGVIGIDLSEEMIEVAKKTYAPGKLIDQIGARVDLMCVMKALFDEEQTQ
jgi:ubiquinone/menaquinone biosynthesis C-methylase UbiE